MPPKLTPHQFSRGLTYVKQVCIFIPAVAIMRLFIDNFIPALDKVPTFLQGLVDDDVREETSDRRPTTSEDLIDNEDDDEILKLSGDEKPQIVVLNERKHMTEEEVQEFVGTRKKSKLTGREFK